MPAKKARVQARRIGRTIPVYSPPKQSSTVSTRMQTLSSRRDIRSASPSSTSGLARRFVQTNHSETRTTRLQAGPPVQRFMKRHSAPEAHRKRRAARLSRRRSSSLRRGTG